MEFTPPEVSKEILSISPEATQAVLDIIAKKGTDEQALRIFVSGSGCQGVQFGMALDDNINETDTVIEAEGIKIVVDHQSIDHAHGVSIEYVNDPQQGTGFVIKAPPSEHGSCGGCSSSNDDANSCGDSGSCCS